MALYRPKDAQQRQKRGGLRATASPTLADAESSMRQQMQQTFGPAQPKDVSMPGHGMAFGKQDFAPSLPYVQPSFLLPEGTAGAGHIAAANRAAQGLQGLAEEQLKRREGIIGRELGEGRGDIQADLQRQLADLSRRGVRGREDMERFVREAYRQLPIQQRQFLGEQAGRGATFSGATEFGKQEIDRAAKQAIGERQQAYNRLVQDLRGAKGAAREQVARQLRDLEQEASEAKQRISDIRRERELEQQYQQAQQKAKASESAAERQRQRKSEAQQWMRARVNELMVGGMPQEQAMTNAIVEARQAFSGVPETYIRGALRPPKPGASPQDRESKAIRKKFGVDISPSRALKITPGKRRQLRRDPVYTETRRDLKTYLAQAGAGASPGDLGGASLPEFLDYLADSGREAGMKSHEIRKKIRTDAHKISLVWSDAMRGIG